MSSENCSLSIKIFKSEGRKQSQCWLGDFFYITWYLIIDITKIPHSDVPNKGFIYSYLFLIRLIKHKPNVFCVPRIMVSGHKARVMYSEMREEKF